MRSRRWGWLLLLTLGASTLLGGYAAAQENGTPAGATLTGCAGSATTTDGDGRPVGSVTAPGGGGASQSRPFLADPEGSVSYRGQSASVITNHQWVVRLFGIPIRSGGSENAEKKRGTRGTEKVSAYLPFKVTGLYYFSGDIKGTGGSCAGAVWVKLTGSPIGTVPWLLGVVLTVGGATLVWVSRPAVALAGAVASKAAPTAPPPPK